MKLGNNSPPMNGFFDEALCLFWYGGNLSKAVFTNFLNAFTEHVPSSKGRMAKQPRTIVGSDTNGNDDACGLASPTNFTHPLTSRSSLTFSFNFALSPDTFLEFCVSCLCLAMLVFSTKTCYHGAAKP